jgi:hypothetical protein
MENNIFTALRSTITVIAISLFGALGAHLVNMNFWAVFIFLFVFQYIIFSFIGNVLTTYFAQKTRQKELDVLEPLSSILECAYCSKPNLITFFPNQNERIEFKCDKCNNNNLVSIGFTVARITESITVPNLTGIPLINEKNNQK